VWLCGLVVSLVLCDVVCRSVLISSRSRLLGVRGSLWVRRGVAMFAVPGGLSVGGGLLMLFRVVGWRQLSVVFLAVWLLAHWAT